MKSKGTEPGGSLDAGKRGDADAASSLAAQVKKTLLKITSVTAVTGKKLLDSCKDNLLLKQDIENQLSRQIKTSDRVHVIEGLVIYDWQIEQNRPVV